MTSPFLGEFLGTMILILLGDGVVAGVLLKRSKAEGSGCSHHGRVGICGDGWSVCGRGLRQQRCALESSGDAGVCGAGGIVREVPALCRCAASGGDGGSYAGLGALSAALERDAGRRAKAGVLLYGASDTECGGQPD